MRLSAGATVAGSGGSGIAGATCRAADALTVERDAVIVVLPAPLAVATPVLLTLAMSLLALVHVAEDVTSFMEPSLYVAVAFNCREAPTVRFSWFGESARLTSKTGDATATLHVAVTSFWAAVIVAVPAP